MKDAWREFLAAAIATLNGSVRQKRLALAYATEDSEKKAAQLCGTKLPTAKDDMKRFYAANGVKNLTHLLIVAFWNLLRDRDPIARGASPRPDSPALPDDVGGEPRDEGPVAER